MRKNIPKKDQLLIWNRDGWTCRYCHDAVFFAPVLKVLDEMNPGCGYYHKNGKTGAMVEVFQRKWASVDHVLPVSHGGGNSTENYVTACWGCNLDLNDDMESKPQPKSIHQENKTMGWDGLSGLYIKFGPKDEWHRHITNQDLVC